MRKIFIAGATTAQGKEQCPWSAAVVAVEGGCMCFESLDEYKVWCNQIILARHALARLKSVK
jgi:hypothetical protein